MKLESGSETELYIGDEKKNDVENICNIKNTEIRKIIL